MGCAVTPPSQPGGLEEITFLYKLTDGACPKSYGANVARLAGLPDEVVRRAADKAAESEVARQQAAASGQQGVQQGAQQPASGGSGGGNNSGQEEGMEVDGGSGAASKPEAAAGAEQPATPGLADLLQRVRAACTAAAGAAAGGAVDADALLVLQQEVKELLQLS